jgi:hypothetical protein
MWCEQGSRG